MLLFKLIPTLILSFWLVSQVKCQLLFGNRTRRNLNFWGLGGGGSLPPFGGSGNLPFGHSGNPIGGLFSGGGIIGQSSFLGHYNPNRISDCPTTEYNKTGVCESNPYNCRRQGGRVVGQCYATPITGSGSLSNNLEVGSHEYNRRVPIGVCCIYQVTCGGTIVQNGTFFRSPNSPAPYNEVRACSVTIPRIHPGITQIRLDFVSFNLARPKDGLCEMDKFIVDGHAQNFVVPPLCGFNSGQHMYLDLDRSNNPITLTVITGQLTQATLNRIFEIRVTFIHHLSPVRAPENCLQYYYDLSGTLKSFNYEPNNLQLGTNSAPFSYLRDLDYAICFKKIPGYCSITYSVPSTYNVIGQPQDFNPSNNPTANLRFFNIFNDPAKGGATGSGPLRCPDDYLILKSMRFCGTSLVDDPDPNTPAGSISEPITDSSSGPLIARFVTNSDDKTALGFLLKFQLNHCSYNG